MRRLIACCRSQQRPNAPVRGITAPASSLISFNRSLSDRGTMSATTPKASSAPINLLRGWPSPTLLPVSQFRGAAQTTLSDPSVAISSLLYGPDAGYGPLRTEVSRWLSSFYGCPDDADRICITGGASQNLACILQVFTDPAITQRVWMAAPCYFLACRIFEDAGFAGRLRAVPEDREGVDMTYLEREISKVEEKKKHCPMLKAPKPYKKIYDHIIYAVPSFSNPSGKTMSLRRRQELVALARDHNALIVTDDVYDFLQWPSSGTIDDASGSPTRAILPRLADIDRALPPHPSDPLHFGHTVSNGSFSKVLGPGVRTGWADATANFAFGLSQCGSSRSGGCPSNLAAAMITPLLQRGDVQQHIRTVLIPAYARRWAKTMEAITRYLVPLGVSVSKVSLEGRNTVGGYFIWLELPKLMTAEQIAEAAKEKENLVVGYGGLFEVWGDEQAAKFRQWIRVCFAWEDEENLTEGIIRLARVVSDKLKDGNEWLGRET